MRGPSVVFQAVNMTCPGPFHFSHIADYIYDFCLLPDPHVGIYIPVCDVDQSYIGTYSTLTVFVAREVKYPTQQVNV